MRNRLREISIQKFIVHDIPSKHSASYLKANPFENNLEPTLSSTYTPSSPTLINFFKDKLISSIGASTSFDIVYKSNMEVVPTCLENYFHDEKNDISSSQGIAMQLHNIQNARNSGGLLLFVYCKIDNKNVIAILKVEREEGVQLKKESTKDGKTNFSMSHIENLMLTDKTKLFKVALFYKDENVTKGILSDQQMGYSTGKEVALFFLDTFLGCRLIDEPNVTTKKFFDNAQKFINESNMSQEEKIKATTHLLSTLTDNSGTVNIQTFAENKLNPVFADTFVKYMQNNGIPSLSFIKDTKLISKNIGKLQFTFDSGISIIAPEGLDERILRYSNSHDGKVKVEIEDSLKKVAGK